MPRATVIWFVIILTGTFLLLLFFNIYRKLRMALKTRRTQVLRGNIKERIESFIVKPDDDFNNDLEEFLLETRKKNKDYLLLVDEYLLHALELPGTENRERLITIARRLDFLSDCLAQIKNRNPRISALGSRRAGLYNFTEAVDEMVTGLDNLSSENQFEILMGLARIGRADAMELAFEKIKNSVIVNERAVIEILNTFPNGVEKSILFHNMLRHETSYISALFLKAISEEMAKALTDDIIGALQHGDKETRAAAVRGLATLNAEAPAEVLIKALEDSDWEIRAQAAKSLSQIKTFEASVALFRVLSDRQWWVRQNAANALISHPDYDILFILAANSGDKYSMDSMISALENAGNSDLLNSIRNLAA